MKTNVRRQSVAPKVYTHEGGAAVRSDTESQLLRATYACLLWEDSFYESGKNIAERIVDLVPQCRPEFVAATAYHARSSMHMRHVPLLIVAAMTRLPEHKKLVGRLLPDVIQRADEIAEFLAIYHEAPINSRTLSKQVKIGLAEAFAKFDEYALAKYKGNGKAWSLRDALFLSHANPNEPGQRRYTRAERKRGDAIELNEREALFQRLVNRELATPDTWEVALSGGADKRETFERLMVENKLGGLAFLRNLRNMTEAGVPVGMMWAYSRNVKLERILPFRFVAAARVVPHLEPMLEEMMFRSLEGAEKIAGKTALLVDVSGSMFGPKVSEKSDLDRADAACALAILMREQFEAVDVFSFSDSLQVVPPRRGFALRDAILRSQAHSGTWLARAVSQLPKGVYSRLVVVTDEQSHDGPAAAPSGVLRAYMVNVASYQHGVGYGARWTSITGWSEAVVRYIQAVEAAPQ